MEAGWLGKILILSSLVVLGLHSQAHAVDAGEAPATSNYRTIRCESKHYESGRRPRTRLDLKKSLSSGKTRVRLTRHTGDGVIKEVFRDVKKAKGYDVSGAKKLIAKSYTGRLDIIIRTASNGDPATAAVVYDDMGLYTDLRLACRSLDKG